MTVADLYLKLVCILKLAFFVDGYYYCYFGLYKCLKFSGLIRLNLVPVFEFEFSVIYA